MNDKQRLLLHQASLLSAELESITPEATNCSNLMLETMSKLSAAFKSRVEALRNAYDDSSIEKPVAALFEIAGLIACQSRSQIVLLPMCGYSFVAERSGNVLRAAEAFRWWTVNF